MKSAHNDHSRLLYSTSLLVIGPSRARCSATLCVLTLSTHSPGMKTAPLAAATWIQHSNVNVDQQQIYVAHHREASNALCTLVEREKKRFQVAAKLSAERDGSRR